MMRRLCTLTAPVLSIGLAAAAMAGVPINTVQDGDWFDPATWDQNRVPTQTLGDQAQVSHRIFIDDTAPGDAMATSVRVGVTGLGQIDVSDFNLIAETEIVMGLFGNPGIINLTDATLETPFIVVGAGGPGVLTGNNVLVDVTGFGGGRGGGPVVRIGDNFPGNILFRDTGDRVRSADGFRLGQFGVININAEVCFTCNPMAQVTGDIEFVAGSLLNFEDAQLNDNSVMVGSRWVMMTYTGSLIGPAPTILSPVGFGLAVDTSVPGEVAIEVTSVPDTYEWIAGDSDYDTGTNWNIGSAPTNGGYVNIRNGGHAT